MPRGRSAVGAPSSSRRSDGPLQFDSSDDDFMSPPRAARRVNGRLAGGGADTVPPPLVARRRRSAAAAPRGRPAAASAARGGAAARRGRTSTAGGSRGGGGPIFGGRQNQLVIRAARGGWARAASRAGFGYRVGRPQNLNGTIVLSDADAEDSNEEGDDVEISGDEDEGDEEEDHFDLEDSFIDDEDVLEFTLDEGDDSNLSADEEGEGGGGGDAGEESFSLEIAQFDRLQEAENQNSRRREQLLRRLEDKEEKENKQAIRTDMFGSCTVCAEDEVTDPVGCIHCANFIGCRKCANRWYRTSKGNDPEKVGSCPLCRHKWTSEVPEVGDMLDLVKTA